MKSTNYKVSVFLVALIANTVLALSTRHAFANPFLSSSSNKRPSSAGAPLQELRSGRTTSNNFRPRRTPNKTVLVNEAVAIGTATGEQPPSTSAAAAAATAFCQQQYTSTQKNWMQQLETFLGMDKIVCTAYLCNILALTLPILLVPIAATDYATAIPGAASSITSQVASISSMAAVGGAAGKFINGFVCNELGTYTCSKWYLAALALCSLAFSFSANPWTLGATFAGMEFFASVQCASLAVMLSDYYKDNAVKMTKALTALGLSATIGEIMAKILGTGLSQMFHWRQVARFGSLVSLLGAVVISRAPGRHGYRALQQQKQRLLQTQPHNPTKTSFRLSSVVASLKVIMGSAQFWKIALAYSMCFVAACSDRILGPFYHAVTGLDHSICGSLTLSVTLGLILGLATGSRKITHMKTLSEKTSFFQRRYAKSALATVGLALTASLGPLWISSKFLLASLVALFTASMAWNISFQCYQFPAMFANDPQFQGNEAVCISFLDGFGYLFSVPIFALLGQLVPSRGWASGWGLLAVLFGGAGVVMSRNLSSILDLNTSNHGDDSANGLVAAAVAP